MSSAQRSNPRKYIIGAIALVVIFVLICIGRFFYNDDYDPDMGTLRWPSSGIAQQLPVPDSNIGHTYWETNDGFDIDVGGYDYDLFHDYVEACKLNGFNVDYYSNPHSFSAKNEEGYELYLYYYEDSKVMSISLTAPKESAVEDAESTADNAEDAASETGVTEA